MINTPHSKTLNANSSFAAWQQRPVYVAQCHSAKLATQLGIFGYRFRVKRAYRDLQAKADRQLIATTIRNERNRVRQLKAVIAKLDVVQQHNPKTGFLVDIRATIVYRAEMHRLRDMQSPAYKSLGQASL